MSGADERWKPVCGYEGKYEVSDLGRVRSFVLPTSRRDRRRSVPKLLKPSPSSNGYLTVVFCKDGQKRGYSVHILVLTAFVGPPPEGMEAAHQDGVRSNCKLSNLAWKTHADNLADKALHGTRQVGEQGSNVILTREAVAEIRARYRKQSRSDGSTALAAKYGVSPSAILAIVKGRRWPPEAMAA
jgi:hypothetical protein